MDAKQVKEHRLTKVLKVLSITLDGYGENLVNENDIKFFIDSALNYFEQVTNEKATCGIPFIEDKQGNVLEYTGIIGITGFRQGNVYITANADMLKALAHIIMGPKNINETEIKDLIGEIANTISGNLRQVYGRDFYISVPVVVAGNSMNIKIPNNCQSYVIPLNWNNYKSYIVACLQ